MPINAHPEYLQAEKWYLLAATLEEKLQALKEMIKFMPQHKSAEALRANLRTRYKKLKEKLAKGKKSGKGRKEGIKKSSMQALIIGMPNTGKSSLFKALTNQDAKISPNPFTTYKPGLGTMLYEDAKIQVIDMPPFPNIDQGIINNADTLLLIIDDLVQLKKSEQFIKKSKAKIIIVFNKSDLLNNQEKRKLEATLRSKRLNFILFSTQTKENLPELKKKIFQSFPIIRIYTKEPKKQATKEPMIMKKDSTLEQVAEKILKGMSSKIKRARFWGPSSKFGGQIIGLDHVLKDKDIVEFQTK